MPRGSYSYSFPTRSRILLHGIMRRFPVPVRGVRRGGARSVQPRNVRRWIITPGDLRGILRAYFGTTSGACPCLRRYGGSAICNTFSFTLSLALVFAFKKV